MNDWRDQAACKGAELKVFYADGKGQHYDAAKAVCSTCPVQNECFDYALDVADDFGVWGGTSPEERRLMRRVLVSS